MMMVYIVSLFMCRECFYLQPLQPLQLRRIPVKFEEYRARAEGEGGVQVRSITSTQGSAVCWGGALRKAGNTGSVFGFTCPPW